MFGIMKRIFPVLVICTLLLGINSRAQQAGTVTIDSSDLEEIRRLMGRVADLEEAYNAQSRRMANLVAEIESLRSALRESNEVQNKRLIEMATREDLKKMAESIREVDRNRESDKKVILEAIERMGKELAKAPPAVIPAAPDRTERPKPAEKPARDLSKEKTTTTTNNELVYTHTVARGENLTLIINAYNNALKDQNKMPITLEMVRRANPKINLNNIYVGQEIIIPVPPDKK
jgi:TolA-binding protein